MKLTSILFAALVCAAGAASAQQATQAQPRPILIQPLTVPTPAPQAQAAPVAVVDLDPERTKLVEENRKLRADNKRLEQEKQVLADQVTAFTALGGSNVHAYCPALSTSRNTAGKESDCAAAGGYNCEEVSGLCRTSCQTSDMCAPGYTCETAVQRCQYTGG